MQSETFTLAVLPDLLLASNQVFKPTLIFGNAHFIRFFPLNLKFEDYFDLFILHLRQASVKSFAFVFRF